MVPAPTEPAELEKNFEQIFHYEIHNVFCQYDWRVNDGDELYLGNKIKIYIFTLCELQQLNIN